MISQPASHIERLALFNGNDLFRTNAVTPTIQCPICGTYWNDESEQANAVKLRRQCITCLLASNASIKSDPYEFALSDVAQQRLQFEAWMITNTTASIERDGKGYRVYEVDLAWQSWQAACRLEKPA